MSWVGFKQRNGLKMIFRVTSVILTEVAAPPLYHGGGGGTWNQDYLMGAGTIARYSKHLQLGGSSSDASQARPGRKEVNLLHAITAEAILFPNRQG